MLPKLYSSKFKMNFKFYSLKYLEGNGSAINMYTIKKMIYDKLLVNCPI